MSQRPLGRVGAIAVLVIMVPIVACVGFVLFGLFFGKTMEDQTVDAIKGAGVPIASVQDAPVADTTDVSHHRVFTTTTGKRGHILVTPRPIDRPTTAARIANSYVPGPKYAYWNSQGAGNVIVVLGDDWRDEHPERIDAAIKSLK